MKSGICCGFLAGLLILNVLCIQATADPVYFAGNGHYYALVDGSFNWDQADAAASSSTYLGTTGYLATITNASESLFITNTFGADNLQLHWIGGFQPEGSPEPAGGWSWVTGEAFAYTNWWPYGEPNNNPSGENRIIFDHGVTADGKAWNDFTGSLAVNGYVVEYDPIPEPASLLLLATGIFGLLGIRRLSK